MIVSCALRMSVLQREAEPQLGPKGQNSASRKQPGIKLADRF